MCRIAGVVFVGLLAIAAGPAPAADATALQGTWKFSFLNENRMITPWLLKFQSKDGKWTGEVIASAPGAPIGITVDGVKTDGDRVSFDLVNQGQKLSFEGKPPTGMAKKILGSFLLRNLVPAELEPTKLTGFDAFEIAKEILATEKGGPELFHAALALLSEAANKKATPEEVRSWANKAFAASEPYGPRWQRQVALNFAQLMVRDNAYPQLALEYARKARRLLDPADSWQNQIRVMAVLVETLRKAGKEDEAREIDKEADTLYLKKMPPFAPEKYAGKTKEKQRRVLVELFTGAQCGPCMAADLAFDGLEKTYAPAEVVLLQYHLHIPGPDPLTNEDAEARGKYYEDEVEGTPTILFNGKLKPRASGGGGLDEAKEKYDDYREVIKSLLEQTTPVKLTARATRTGDKIEVSATASDVPTPGEKIRLRLLLVEELVRYTGGNQVRFHHHVVRDMPGGAKGLALTQKTGNQEIGIDLALLRARTSKYLDKSAKETPFPNDLRPLDLKNLYLVALVQNDGNKEILQSIQVKVSSAGE